MVTAAAVGLLDAALVAFGLAGARGAFQYVPARIWVVAPVCWLAVAALAFGILLPISRRWAGIFAGAALLTLLLGVRLNDHPWILAAALVILCVVLIAANRPLMRWQLRSRRRMALGIPAAAAFAVLPAMFAASASTGQPASRGTGPNVIVIFLDTVRYDAIFDREGNVHEGLATFSGLKKESTVFTRAYAPSSWTLPSHLSAMTGLPPHELGVGFDAQVYDRQAQTLAERFRGRGYRTAAVISNSFLNAGSGFNRGFDTFEHATNALDICRTAPGLIADRYWPWFAASVCNWTASEVTRRALALMEDEDRPFFVTLNYMDAHDPYYVEASCGGGPPDYAASVRCLDRQLAPIAGWRSPRRPTVLAILSDHGEHFGEHGLMRHGNSLHVQALHVPLMIRPARGLEARQTAPVSTAALGRLIDNVSDVPGGPVLGLLHPPAASNLPSQWSAIDESWHLIARERGDDALYDLRADPAEQRNLIASAPRDAAIDRLRAAIADMRRSPRPDLRRFRSLGYVH